MAMGITLGGNQYGKAEVRMVHVDRSSAVHQITDVTVTSQLFGDFTLDTHITGANDKIIATDTQKNTVYALARRFGVDSAEAFGLRMARHFVDGFDYVEGARQEVLQHGWNRISTTDGPHDHAFVRDGGETRTAIVVKRGDEEIVLSGLTGLTVLKSTGSEFHGFPDVPYTSLVETDDRILATAVSARWRHLGTDVDWDKSYADVRHILLDRFAEIHSLSLQQTLYGMGEAVLTAHPGIAEIRFSMPNKHHFLVDLSEWGLDNPNEVWYAADRPYGLIEATVTRDDVPPVDGVWDGAAGFI
jgi:urate oxidase